jgi:hypothetical protein
MQTVIGLLICLFVGFLIGVIFSSAIHIKHTIGTIYIDPNFEDAGETYRFSFDNFDEARKHKSVCLKIEDHTH